MLLDARSRALRRVIVETYCRAGRGHLPSAFSCLEIVRVLYDSVMRISPAEAADPDRDRFILSKGHGSLALYVLLADKGFFPSSELENFCAFGSRLSGLLEKNGLPGVEVGGTGSLGHGPSIGVGLALSARLDQRPSRVYVLCGDGETNEGSVWEALLSAAKHRLGRFTLIIDYNRMQSWGTVPEIAPLEPYADKLSSFGFSVTEVDGHDVRALESVLAGRSAEAEGRPTAVIAHTVKGRGSRLLENDLSWHHRNQLSDEERAGLLGSLEGQP